MNCKSSDLMEGPIQLSWTACIPTINRLDVLQVSIQCILAQTRLPKQVIVIDASDNFVKNRADIKSLFDGSDVEIIYEGAAQKSSAVQRNQALPYVKSDVILFMDDDSLLFPDCADGFLDIFEKDREHSVVGLALRNVDSLPPAASFLNSQDRAFQASGILIEKKIGGVGANANALSSLERFPLWRFFRREILMQAMDRMFIPYDKYRNRPSGSATAKAFDLVTVRHLPGYGMAVRSYVARLEPFNPFLLAYCPCEDLDASYRYGRHGICAYSSSSRVKHYEVQGGRITRFKATSLSISNIALFIHTNSDSHFLHESYFVFFVFRKILAEFFKDMMARRFSLPQTRGVVVAIPRSYGIFRRNLFDAQSWYVEQQRKFLQKGKDT